MPDQLLISDANILIDMEVGGLIDSMFDLPYTYGTPAMLFEQELSQYHAHLPVKGLQLMELAPESVQRMADLGDKYTGVSSHDLSALALAEQIQAPLLTGDGKLRQVCLEEDVDVCGTVWLVGEIIGAGLISVDEAKIAYQKMEEDGSRLPWDEVGKQLKRFRKK